MSKIPNPSFSAKLVQFEDVAHETRSFRFCISSETSPSSFSPGQFLLLCLPDDGARRAYSLASAPQELPFFELVVKHVPNGKASTFLWDSLPGKVVDFLGPLGKFGIRFPQKRQIFFATGTGIAPFRSMLHFFSSESNAPEIFLFFGVRNEEYLCFQEEFSHWESKSPKRCHITFCVSQPKLPPENYREGRVTTIASTLDASFFENAEVSLCGGYTMVKEMQQILMEKGVSPEHINRESW
ncbi:FAD-dependent oxidoreductase [Candidatus Peregrinibacteria bacterium]|nr:MAG: FAD-dependent oxidoreductase [Candidatus Peregrinibacteria bacterium]